MQIRTFATLRDLLGTSHIALTLERPTTVGQVLQRLAADYPMLEGKLWDAEHHLTGYVAVLLNGRSIEFLSGLDTPVGDDDALSLFPPVGGG